MDTYLYLDAPGGEVDIQFPLEGSLLVGLKEICYVVGYYNISQEKRNNTVHYTKVDGSFSSAIPDGRRSK